MTQWAMVHCHLGGPDLVQTSDLGRGQSPAQQGRWDVTIYRCPLEMIWAYFLFLHKLTDGESSSGEDAASQDVASPPEAWKPPGGMNYLYSPDIP